MEQNINEVKIETTFNDSDYLIVSIGGKLRRILFSDLKALIGTGEENVNPDWLQSDPTQADFIKNKPFYEEEGVEVDLLEQGEYSFSDSNGSYIYEKDEVLGLVAGEKYNLIIDDVEYKNIEAKEGTGANQHIVYLGNGVLFGETTDDTYMVVDDTSSNSSVIYVTDSTATSHALRIYQDGSTVKQIDPKFINGYTKEQIDEMFGEADRAVSDEELIYQMKRQDSHQLTSHLL